MGNSVPVSSATDATEKQRKISKQKRGPQKKYELGRNPPCISCPCCSSSNGINIHSRLLRQNADLLPLCSAFEKTVRATSLSLYQLHTGI